MSNYARKLRRKIVSMKHAPGGVAHITVVHQNGCARLKGGECDCDPEIRDGMPPQIQRQMKFARRN